MARHTFPSSASSSGAVAFLAALLAAGLLVGCGRSADSERAGAGPVATTVVTSDPTTTSPGTTDAGAASPTGTSGGPSSSAAYTSVILDSPMVDPRLERVGREIARRAEAAELPGTSLLVLQDGQLVHEQAYGDYTVDRVVPIASASKWLSGVVIMSLVDEGKIELDEPISTYLPDTTGPSATITMRQLLSFTSGLEFDEKIPCYADWRVTLADCNRTILSLPLLGRPGTGYRYTGTHLHVAAGVAEAVTGQTWNELVAERLTGPLHMDDTTFERQTVDGLASDGHPAPAGGAVSSLGDYGRFLEMLVHDGVAPDGTRIVSAEAIAEMGTNQIADADYLSASGPRKAAQTPYGLAHWLDRTDAEGHAIVESSPGAFGFRPWIDHANGIAGVHLVVDRVSENDTGEGDASGGFVMEMTAEALGGTYPQR